MQLPDKIKRPQLLAMIDLALHRYTKKHFSGLFQQSMKGFFKTSIAYSLSNVKYTKLPINDLEEIVDWLLRHDTLPEFINYRDKGKCVGSSPTSKQWRKLEQYCDELGWKSNSFAFQVFVQKTTHKPHVMVLTSSLMQWLLLSLKLKKVSNFMSSFNYQDLNHQKGTLKYMSQLGSGYLERVN